MSKRWTQREDLMLHEHFDAVGDFVGVHDLGRPPGAATRRVAFLKECGAWAALDRSRQAAIAYHKAVGNLVEDHSPALEVVR